MMRSQRGAWCGLALAWLGAALWLFAHPVQLSSDDALYLARGIERFSVLEFRPQFPGYPGMVAMGRLLLPLAGSAETALAWLTAAIALALPLAGAWAGFRVAGNRAALWAFALVLAQPLMPDLALSLLTDGAGILFVLVFLALLPREDEAAPRALLAGAALGWAAACRPSDGVLILAAMAGAMSAAPRLARPVAVGFALVLVPVAATLLIAEPLYLREGWRFVEGHALVWGNTPFSRTPRPEGWGTAVAAIPLGWGLIALLSLAVLAALRCQSATRRAAAWGVAGHALWTWGFQNPESLRHLSPLLVLGPVVLATGLPRGRAGAMLAGLCLALELVPLVAKTNPDPRAPSPLHAALPLLSQPGAVTATNEGVDLLRALLPDHRVYDQHFAADAALGLALAPAAAWRLSTTPVAGCRAARDLPGRFLGERSLFLYRSGKLACLDLAQHPSRAVGIAARAGKRPRPGPTR